MRMLKDKIINKAKEKLGKAFALTIDPSKLQNDYWYWYPVDDIGPQAEYESFRSTRKWPGNINLRDPFHIFPIQKQ